LHHRIVSYGTLRVIIKACLFAENSHTWTETWTWMHWCKQTKR